MTASVKGVNTTVAAVNAYAGIWSSAWAFVNWT